MRWICPGRADLVEIPTGQQANAWRLRVSQSCCMSGTYDEGAVRWLVVQVADRRQHDTRSDSHYAVSGALAALMSSVCLSIC